MTHNSANDTTPLSSDIIDGIHYIIRCLLCEASEESLAAQKPTALKEFSRKGWRNLDGEIVCPECAKPLEKK